MTESSTMPVVSPPRQILVVEDDVDMADLIATVLLFEGFEPLMARNGREALDLLATGFRPGVILLDLMMPVMDGREFRNRQRDQPDIAPIPVIICSAEEPATAADLAAYAMFSKPLDFDALIGLLRSM